MTVKNGKIVRATELELFKHYLKAGFDDLMSFTDYIRRCVELGTEITKKGGEQNAR